MTAPLWQRLDPRGKAASNQKETVGQVDIGPAQRQYLTHAQARVEQEPERLRVTTVLEPARCELLRIDDGSAGAVLAVLAGTW
jgi:hypothetical protein